MNINLKNISQKAIANALLKWQNENNGGMPTKINLSPYGMRLYLTKLKTNKNVPLRLREFDVEKRLNKIIDGKSFIKIYDAEMVVDLELKKFECIIV